jgi:CBS domain-containing protein
MKSPDTVKVEDVMTIDVELASPDLTIREAAKLMRDRNIGSLPVGEDDQLTGMITDRDITCRATADGRDPMKTKIRDFLSKDIACCYDDETVADAARLMKEKHVRRLAVLSRKKRMVGLLSIDDVAHCSHDLAGEILDIVSKHPTH